mgnify:CR=1 FL=1
MNIAAPILLCLGICIAPNLAGQDGKVEPDTSKFPEVIKVLAGKFGQPASVVIASAIFTDYTWKSTESEIGGKFRNEMDKFLNVLAIKSDSDFDTKTQYITDVDIWETPRIMVKVTSMIHTVNPERIVVVRVNEK